MENLTSTIIFPNTTHLGGVLKQATLKPQLYLNVFYLLILIFVSCDHKPPFGHIYYPPEDENFTQLAPLNDTSWASVGVRRQIEQHKSDSYFKLMDAQYQTVWERHYEGEDFEMGYKIIPSGDNYILLGLSKFSGERQGDSRVAIVANDGHELWNSIIGGAGDDRLFGGVATPDNGFLFVGSTVR